MKFILEIELGNEAMETGEDVAIALCRHADYIATQYSLGGLVANAPRNGKHNIVDANGNTVGFWKVSK